MKKCSKCKEIKEFECFYKDKSKKDGLNCACKKCRKAVALKYRGDPSFLKVEKSKNKKRYLKHKEDYNYVKASRIRSNNRYSEKKKDPDWILDKNKKSRERYSKQDKTLNRPTSDKLREYNKRMLFNYPEKRRARNGSQYLKPLTKGNQLHHWSYNAEHYKDVIEISIKNHHTAHRFIKYDQEYMMYRTMEGELLDTKEAHLAYITLKIS